MPLLLRLLLVALLLSTVSGAVRADAPTIVAPDAWAAVRADGTLAFGPLGIAGTTWMAGSARYEITFSGHSYGAGDVSVIQLLGDAGSCPAGATARQAHLGGKLLVFIVNAAGENIQCGFGLVSYFAVSRGGIETPLDNDFAPHAPIAIGEIQASGALGPNPFGVEAATWNPALSRYEIDIDGYAFSIRDVPALSLIGDEASCPAGTVIRHSSVGGRLLVYILDSSGNAIQCAFQFFVYGADLDYVLLRDGFEGDAAAGARIPAAYGYINQFNVSDIQHAHRVGSALWNAALERYEIALDGLAFGNSDRALVNISGDAGSCPAGAVARASSVSGLLLVYIVQADGTQRQCSFRFVVQDG